MFLVPKFHLGTSLANREIPFRASLTTQLSVFVMGSAINLPPQVRSQVQLGNEELSFRRWLQESRHALLVTGSGVAMDHAFFGGAVNLRLESGEKLRGFVRFTGFGQGANFLFGRADSADLGTIKGAAAQGRTSLLGSGTGIGHSPPNCRKFSRLSTVDVC